MTLNAMNKSFLWICMKYLIFIQLLNDWTLSVILCQPDNGSLMLETDKVTLNNSINKNVTVKTVDELIYQTIYWIVVICLIIIMVILICFLGSRINWSRLFEPYRAVLSENPFYRSTSQANLTISSNRPYKLVACNNNNILNEIQVDDLEVIGAGKPKGRFGTVSQGKCKRLTINNENNSIVSIVMSKALVDSDIIDPNRLAQVVAKWKTLKCDFIIEHLGVSIFYEPWSIVMAEAPLGNLRTFLQAKYQSFQNGNQTDTLLSDKDLIYMAAQIADGMLFLHRNEILHLNLSLSNCLLFNNYNVKLSDFGYYQFFKHGDFQSIYEQGRLSPRWMAPESVKALMFDISTDVWSYGVVLWEMMSCGEEPYADYSEADVRKLVLSFNILNQPTAINSPLLWDIANSCWLADKNHRIYFDQIIAMLYPSISSRQRFQFIRKSSFISRESLHKKSSNLIWQIKRDDQLFANQDYIQMLDEKIKESTISKQSCQCDYIHKNLIEIIQNCKKSLDEIERLEMEIFNGSKDKRMQESIIKSSPFLIFLADMLNEEEEVINNEIIDEPRVIVKDKNEYIPMSPIKTPNKETLDEETN